MKPFNSGTTRQMLYQLLDLGNKENVSSSKADILIDAEQ